MSSGYSGPDVMSFPDIPDFPDCLNIFLYFPDIPEIEWVMTMDGDPEGGDRLITINKKMLGGVCHEKQESAHR